MSTTLQSVAFGAEPQLVLLPVPVLVESWWLTAVALGGQGRYAQARAALDVVDRRTVGRVTDHERTYASLAASTRASFRRQTGWHAQAALDDGRALAIVTGLDSSPSVDAAVCDALTGLAADALGIGRLSLGWRLLAECGERIGSGSPEGLWRQSIRLEWVSAELALASGDFTRALRHADTAVELSGDCGSARHKVKSDLLCCAAMTGFDASEAAQRAGAVFDQCMAFGLLPLAWASSMLIEGVSGVATTPNSSVLDAAIAVRGGVFRIPA
ncbi:hypothetical protein [Rhodococcus sp. ARC_M6]|uniref:hypothetical protein n=1 Tax=Rhodococcus sp. ARC_M6 TaxID=2928852 RepID=UPI001FB3D9F2|nr:hypothetical protein [Rhodococcus sp. ARC_M6]MCJ0905114.1 hypothetical protein [Rhodococcus sp. ARC_M6]